MDSRLLLVVALLVAVLLPGSLFIGDFYLQPGATESYAVTHESSDAFDQVFIDTDLEQADATPASELPSDTEAAFNELAAATGPDEEGWVETSITVCPETYVVCNAYGETDFPPDAAEDFAGATSNRYSLIETADDEQYIVERQYGGGIGFFGLFIWPPIFVTFLFYGIALANMAIRYRRKHPVTVQATTAIGLLVLLAPHLLLLVGRSPDGLFFFAVPTLLIGLAGAVVGITTNRPVA
ncbi:hypothetical protein G6M89_19165 [Natronolimnobius sp. AArcel1]|uniref:hypothetical protein n=1 Tax=Natronolimnobius sp. AArcel1 TaxID=1679093 RepID=UPI0013E9AD68|nr:hypothetical protein [Natronolimnobius sp. AArcel1]NGM71097.1 hypothetical protein [Natronolimnobius sp. AArcel1]